MEKAQEHIRSQKVPPARPSFFSSFEAKLMSLMDAFNLFLFVLLIILATTQVLFRYLLMIPLPWTEELSRFLLVWITFLGAASVTRRKLHIKVDLFTSKLSPKQDHLVGVGIYGLMFLFLVVVLRGTWIMMEDAWPIFTGTIPWLSQAYLYLGAVIGTALMLVYVSFHLLREIRWAVFFFQTWGAKGPSEEEP